VTAWTAAFEDFAGHRSVVVRWSPSIRPKAQVLFVSAFGDEMNQTRRMMRLTAEALATCGIASTIFDPHGTGDSSADFEEASVERWLDDADKVFQGIRSISDVPVILVGCRLGVALAAELTRRLLFPPLALIGWAPLLKGRTQLSALLRAERIAEGRNPHRQHGGAKSAWEKGAAASLAGYPISPILAAQLEGLDASNAPRVASSTLIEVRPSPNGEGAAPSAALLAQTASWRREGIDAEVLAVEGPPFWNMPDLVDLPKLVELSVAAIERRIRGDAR